MLDDIDTDSLTELPLQPSYIIETSPGNHHVGFGIADRENVAGFALLQERMTKAGIIKAKADKAETTPIAMFAFLAISTTRPRS